MKKIMLLILVLLQMSIVNGQVYEGKTYVGTEAAPERRIEWNKEIAKEIKGTTTIVALPGEASSEGQALIKAMDKFWKINKYKFIDASDVEQYINNPQYTILTPYTLKIDGTKYYYFGLASGREKYSKLRYLKFHSSVKLPHKKTDKGNKLEEYAYLANFIVRYCHREIEYWDSNTLNPADKLAGALKNTYTEGGKEEITSKTILFCKDDFSDNFNFTKFEANLKKNLGFYTQKFKVVSRDEISKALEVKDPNVVVVPMSYNGSGIVYSPVTMNGLGKVYGAKKLKGAALVGVYAAYIVVMTGLIAAFFYVVSG